MKLGIATDSTSDLPLDLAEHYGIEVVPTMLIVEDKQYADGAGISRNDFYARLPSMEKFPTTAAPSIGEFSTRYQKLFDAGCSHVISIHAASQLTSISSVAEQAARDFPNRVTVVDSGSLSMGLGFHALAAAEAAESDSSLEGVLASIQSAHRRIRVFAALDTMDYLRRSGRLPAAVTMIGGALSIKPVIELTEGQVKFAAVVRTTHQANERMSTFLKDGCLPLERLAIMHTGAEPRARAFLDQLMNEIPRDLPREIRLVNATPVIGAHLGPNGLGFAAVRAE